MLFEPLESRVLFSAPGANWPLVFDDEFNGSALDTGKWTSHLAWGGDTGDGRHHNNNYLSYISDSDAVVSGGTLKLLTERRDVTAADGRVFHYTEGLIQTANHFRFKYGYAEVRAKLPTGAGP